MQSYIAKIRMHRGGNEYVTLDAINTVEARQSATEAYHQRGAVVAVVPVVSMLACPHRQGPARSLQDARRCALERIAARHANAVAAVAVAVKVKKLRNDGRFQVMLLAAGMPLVRCGGDALRDLREDVFDSANRTNARAGVHGISEIYASALMGGEPFAIWN